MTQAETGFVVPDDTKPHITTAVEFVAQAGQRVADALLRSQLTDEELLAAAGELDIVAKRLEEGSLDHATIVKELLTWSRPAEHDPVSGVRNMMAPPLRMHGDGPRKMRGEVTLGYVYQGPPGYAHGGISAMILDHALGVCNGWSGKSGVTGTLTLRYHKLTPLCVPLTVRTECVSVEGRKITTVGRIEYEGETCVSAEGLFIELKGGLGLPG
jgi:acyl-coenzyme A thioesterase PaaI-like protein